MDVHGCIVAWMSGCIKYNESENTKKVTRLTIGDEKKITGGGPCMCDEYRV